MSVYDTQNESTRDEALEAADAAVREGKLIVLPTDTVYGIGADAFAPQAVQSLLDAKGRGRNVPPPVLVADQSVLLALAVDVPEYAERLAEEFWPGALTLILNAQPSLAWDLGETRGTVALRMPDDPTALALLKRTGPLAVSSANRHGKDAATTVIEAATQLGDSVEVYLDGGTARIGTSSTIIDTTVEPAEIVREGALTREQIIAAVGDIFTADEPDAEPEQESAAEAAPDDDSATASESKPDDDVTDTAVPTDAEDTAENPETASTPAAGLSLPAESEVAVATTEVASDAGPTAEGEDHPG